MTQIAKRHAKPQIIIALKRQLWLLFIAIVLVIVGESMLNLLPMPMPQKLVEQTNVLLWSKGFALGALLHCMSIWVFATLAFRHTGSKARRNIVYHMYLGEIVKWTICLLGFALIFITIKPLNTLAVFIGFIVMQIGFSWISWRIL